MRYAPIIMAFVVAAAHPAASQVFDRGFAACSTSDSGHIFRYDYHNDLWEVTADVDLLPEGDYPYDATMRPCPWTEFWVTGAAGDGVIVVDGDGIVTHRIATGEYPVSVAFNESLRLALVSCRDSDRLDVIDTEAYQVTGHLDIPGTALGPGSIVYSIRGHRFFLAAWYGDEIFAIAGDGSAILDQAPLGNDLWQVALVPSSLGPLYVTDRGDDVLRVVDTETLAEIRSVPVGDDPWGLDADLDYVMVACEDDATVHAVHIWDWSTTVIPLPADTDPRDVDLVVPLPVGGKDRQLMSESAYVAGGLTSGGSPVYVIDLFTESISDTIYLPGTNTNTVAVMPRLIVSGVDDGIPPLTRPSLAAAPNPFNPRTTVSFELGAAGPVDLAVYDPDGRWVRTLVAGIQPPGIRTAVWDGRDHAGSRVASGTYVIRLRTGGSDVGCKVTLLE
ncbi:hypothetical protein KKG45_13740 [bacterium]|nr:hypothetical protein [bacterium]MBU1074303.1 hypothetical protein [bacterium]